MIKPIFYFLLLTLLFSSLACNDPAAIDTDIVDIDLVDVQTMDDFALSSYSTFEDSIVSFSQLEFLQPQYPFGIDEDPVFGTSTNGMALQFLLLDPPLDFTNAIVDSVILELHISQNLPFSGDSVQTIGIEVLQIEETLDVLTRYYTTQETELGEIIGTYTGVPNFTDPVPTVRFQQDTILIDTLPPHIRVRLTDLFGQQIIFSDPAVLQSNGNFLEQFRGLYLRPTLPNNGLISFDLNSVNTEFQAAVNGATVLVFYTQNGVRSQYQIAVSSLLSVKVPEQMSDLSGSTLEEFIDDEVLGDSLTFVQGLSGPNVVVGFNDLNRLDGSIINGATLEVFATTLNGDNREVPQQLVLIEEFDDGTVNLTRDFALSLIFGGTVANAGGQPEDMGNGIYRYTFDIGGQLQDILAGEKNDKVAIRVDNKISDTRRAVIFGAGHSTYPMKLNVTYTKL